MPSIPIIFPLGSINIITEPETAPMPINSVRNIRKHLAVLYLDFVLILKPRIYSLKVKSTNLAGDLSILVPLTGLEPVRYRYRGILSPLCLPIPPQRHISNNILFKPICQDFF